MVAPKKKGVAKVFPASRSREPVLPTDVREAAVHELPPPALNPRTMRFARKMAEVREQVGEGVWVGIGSFTGRKGAATVAEAMRRGDRPVDGEVGDWDIEARRSSDGGSTLYVRLRGAREE